MASLDDVKPMRGNKMPRVEEQAQVLKLPPDEFVKGRLVGPVISMAMYWFDIIKKDGQKTSVPRMCLDYDPISQKMVRDICPYRASGKGRLAQTYYQNFLVRDLQENQPRKFVKPSGKELKRQILLDDFKCHIKQFSTKTWTPYRLLRMTATLAEKIINLKSLNVHKVKGVAQKFSVAHPKYGIDIQVMYSPDAKGPQMYDCQRDDKTPLTEDELNYCFQPLNLTAFKPASLKDANRDWEELKKVIVDPEEEADADSSKKSKERKKDKEAKRSKNRDKDRSTKSSSKSSKSNKTSKSDKKSGKKKSGSKSSNWDM